MKAAPVALRLLRYAWTSPNTLLGIAAGAVVLLSGGRARCISGVIEFSGGWPGWLLAAGPSRYRFDALTLGHTIVGVDDAALAAARTHEHVHVRQYERWGPLFLPAYFGSSAWQVLRGRHAYVDNRFEKQAFAQAGVTPRRAARAAP